MRNSQHFLFKTIYLKKEWVVSFFLSFLSLSRRSSQHFSFNLSIAFYVPMGLPPLSIPSPIFPPIAGESNNPALITLPLLYSLPPLRSCSTFYTFFLQKKKKRVSPHQTTKRFLRYESQPTKVISCLMHWTENLPLSARTQVLCQQRVWKIIPVHLQYQQAKAKAPPPPPPLAMTIKWETMGEGIVLR